MRTEQGFGIRFEKKFGPNRIGRISPKFELIRSNPKTLEQRHECLSEELAREKFVGAVAVTGAEESVSTESRYCDFKVTATDSYLHNRRFHSSRSRRVHKDFVVVGIEALLATLL
jgi:hypothetical protein